MSIDDTAEGTAPPRSSTRREITRAAVLRALRHGWPDLSSAQDDHPSVEVEVVVAPDASTLPRDTRQR